MRYLPRKSYYIDENHLKGRIFMKKTWLIRALALMTAILLSVSLVSCKEEKPKTVGAYGDDLEALLADIYAVGGYSDMLTGMLEAPADTDNMFYTRLMTVEITKENEMGFLGANGIPYERAIASEPNLNPTLYSLCLLKVAEDEDAAEVAKQVKKSANPMKWVCTGLSSDDVYVDYADDVVILVMSARDGESLIDAFHSVMNGEK